MPDNPPAVTTAGRPLVTASAAATSRRLFPKIKAAVKTASAAAGHRRLQQSDYDYYDAYDLFWDKPNPAAVNEKQRQQKRKRMLVGGVSVFLIAAVLASTIIITHRKTDNDVVPKVWALDSYSNCLYK